MSNYRHWIQSMFRDSGYQRIDWDNTYYWASAKTMTDRGMADGRPFFAKVRKSSKSVVATQQKTYALLETVIPSNTGVHVPQVLFCDAERGILVTEEAPGQLMTDCLLSSLRGCGLRQLDQLIESAGRALAIIHLHAPTGQGGKVLLYLDYSPQNIFFSEARKNITLVDPPERIEYGEREQDVAVATVELMKQFFRSFYGLRPHLWRRARSRFLSAYQALYSQELDRDLLAKYEKAHVAKLVALNKKYLMLKHGPGNAARAMLRASLTITLLIALKSFHSSE